MRHAGSLQMLTLGSIWRLFTGKKNRKSKVSSEKCQLKKKKKEKERSVRQQKNELSKKALISFNTILRTYVPAG